MKVLITGGAGYIGTSLLPLLLERGYKVTVFDSLLFGGDQLLPFFKYSNFSFVKGDIRDLSAITEQCKDKDIVIHLAAIVGFPACRNYPELAQTTNVDGTKNIAHAVSKDQLVLFGSTGSNYGALEDEVCTEDTPLHPLSHYGKTKTAAEQYLRENTTCIAHRFATAFGVSPRLRLDLLINDFTYLAIKQQYLVVYESHFMRTFIHVSDIARSFVFAIDNADKMKGEVYNVGSEKMNYSKHHICEMIKKETGTYVHYADVGEDADKRNYVVSYNKINTLGYDTTITVEAGIKELVRALQVIQVHNRYTNI